MKAKEFLKQLNPHSAVFEENIQYDYTEKQLILFAELYHKHQAKNNEVLDLVSDCSHEWRGETYDSMGFALTEFCDKCDITRDCR